ncbi:MAG: VOC family protein [Tannerellaceae bacterium]|nr:VOC family protein [Tannerellaceae bacterium]
MEKSVILNHVTGLQHIGIPTNDIETTIRFYESLGFEIRHQAYNAASDEEVAFLELRHVMIETYQNRQATMKTGAIDHIALDVVEIESLFDQIKAAGYTLLDDQVRFLPFWEHGVKFFTIEGPNAEKIEFCEKCKSPV